MGTQILPAVVTGSSRDWRSETRPDVVFDDYRVDRTDPSYSGGVHRTFWYEKRPRVVGRTAQYQVHVVEMRFPDGTPITFDMRHAHPDTGEGMHVVLHRIGRRHLMDVWRNRRAEPVVTAVLRLAEPDRCHAYAAAILAALALHLAGLKIDDVLGYGIGAGIAVHVAEHLHNRYVEQRLAFLRRRAFRRIAKAVARGETLRQE